MMGRAIRYRWEDAGDGAHSTACSAFVFFSTVKPANNPFELATSTASNPYCPKTRTRQRYATYERMMAAMNVRHAIGRRPLGGMPCSLRIRAIVDGPTPWPRFFKAPWIRV